MIASSFQPEMNEKNKYYIFNHVELTIHYHYPALSMSTLD